MLRKRRVNKLKYGARNPKEEALGDYLKGEGIAFTYETLKISYVVPASKHVYTPDFILESGLIIEYKGFFDLDDRKKHLLVKEQHPNLDIRFVFERDSPIRKGSKTRYSDWCTKNGFKFAIKTVPKEWLTHDTKV